MNSRPSADSPYDCAKKISCWHKPNCLHISVMAIFVEGYLCPRQYDCMSKTRDGRDHLLNNIFKARFLNILTTLFLAVHLDFARESYAETLQQQEAKRKKRMELERRYEREYRDRQLLESMSY